MVDDAFRASRDERLRALSEELGALPARERSDALHALLGTQVAQLPEDLEHYYAFFFRDRRAVVSAFWSYKTAFDALDTQLEDGKSRDAGEVLVAQQNAAVDRANDLARRLMAAVAQANAKIETYNGLVLDDQQRIGPLSPVTAS